MAQLRLEVSQLKKQLDDSCKETALELSKAKRELAENQRDILSANLIRGVRPQPQPLRQPDPDWNIEQLLTAYLTAPTLAHRYPFVQLNPEIQELMEAYYTNYNPAAEGFRFLNLPSKPVPIGERVTVTVQLADKTSADYVLVHTPTGLRVDWKSSNQAWAKTADEAFRKSRRLENAQLTVQRIKVTEGSPTTRIAFRFENKSLAIIDDATISFEFYDENDVYLTKRSVSLQNLQPGANAVEEVTLLDTKASSLKRQQARITYLTIESGGKIPFPADRYFELKQLPEL